MTVVGLSVKSKLLTAVLAAALPVLLSSCGSTLEPATTQAAASTPSVLVEDAWVRATVGAKDTSMTAAYMSLTNPGDADIRLTSATSPVAGVMQLHEMATKDGKMVMQQKTGGIHVLGDEVPVTLEFSDGTSHDLTVPVKAFTEEEEHYHPSETQRPSDR